nr:hypothetical protein [Pseudomonadota bacterium]
MRDSPSCVIAVRRFGVWRRAVCAVAAASLASLVACVLLAPAGHGFAARIAVTLGGLAVSALGASLLRVQATGLQWDGLDWTFRELGRSSTAPVPGELEIALDLGAS